MRVNELIFLLQSASPDAEVKMSGTNLITSMCILADDTVLLESQSQDDSD